MFSSWSLWQISTTEWPFEQSVITLLLDSILNLVILEPCFYIYTHFHHKTYMRETCGKIYVEALICAHDKTCMRWWTIDLLANMLEKCNSCVLFLCKYNKHANTLQDARRYSKIYGKHASVMFVSFEFKLSCTVYVCTYGVLHYTI